MNDSGSRTGGAVYVPSSAGYGKGAAPTTLDEAIAAADRATSQARGAKDRADGAFAVADSNLTLLTNLKRDSDKVLQTYQAAHAQLTIDQQFYSDFYEQEKDSLEDLLGAATEDVEKKVGDRNAADTATANAVDTATIALATAESVLATAESGRKASAAALDRLKQLAAAIGADHAKLKAQRDEMTKARQSGQYGLEYWLLTYRDFADVVAAARAELIDPAGLPAELLAAVLALIDAQRAEETATAAVAVAKAALTEAQRKDTEQKTKGEAELRKQLLTVVPRPAESN